MDKETIFHIGGAVAVIHIVYLQIRVLAHVKDDFGAAFFFGYWVVDPAILDDVGKKLRIQFLIFMPVYFVTGFVIARFL